MKDQIISASSIPQVKTLSIIDLILSADIMSQCIMVFLLLLSIWTWAIILDKYIRCYQIKKKISKFETLFWSGQMLDQLYDRVRRVIDNPLSAIFVAAMSECKRYDSNMISDNYALKEGLKDRVLQSMYIVRNREIQGLEQGLAFIAMVGSKATFIGLFGTVWGIMHSFQSIAVSKNTSLAVIAPGLAEALLATAIGLIVSIPAVMFYNLLVAKLDEIDNKLNDFIGELNTLLLRAIDENKI